MTKSFDEWWSECKKNGFVPTFSDVASNAFKAGQQSKQAEVDELQKRIDKAVEHIEGYYGVVELSMIVDILRGDQS